MAISGGLAKDPIYGDSYNRTLKYIVRGSGSDDDTDALDWAEANAPTTYDALPRQLPMTIKPLSDALKIWEIEVKYGSREKTPPVSGTANVEYTFDFSTQGVNVKQSISTIASYAASGTAPDFKQSINVSSDGTVEGVDIEAPVASFAYTLTDAAAVFSSAYRDACEELVGKVNSTTFFGRAAGEVLCTGISGRVSNAGDSSITFRFARSENKTGIVIGDITGIAKKGWELLWVHFGHAEDSTAKRIVKRPVAAYVEKVYDTADFATILGFG